LVVLKVARSVDL
jgi:hypothetical protein